MGIDEMAVTVVPVLGFAAGFGLARRGRTQTGVAIALLSTSVAVVVAFLGNAHPIVCLFALAMLTAALIADENKRPVLTIFCFSVAVFASIVAAMYV
jgi:hypothetical protein